MQILPMYRVLQILIAPCDLAHSQTPTKPSIVVTLLSVFLGPQIKDTGANNQQVTELTITDK